MEAIIIWGVIWLVGLSVGSWLVFFAVGALFEFITDNEIVAAIVGWLAASLWAIFALIQVVIHVVHLIQFLVG